MKTFSPLDILSVTTKRNLSPKGMAGVFEIFWHMFDDPYINDSGLLVWHKKADAWLRQEFPLLCQYGDSVKWQDAVQQSEEMFGSTVSVPQIPKWWTP